jgi:hypothetical protein
MSTAEGEARRERERVMGIGSGRMAIIYTPLGLPSDRRVSLNLGLNCQPHEHRRSTEEHVKIIWMYLTTYHYTDSASTTAVLIAITRLTSGQTRRRE